MDKKLRKCFGLFLTLISIFTFSQAVNAWDGAEVKEPSLVEEVYQISDASELKWFQEEVNKGNDISAKLIDDIDLEGNAWIAIGTTSNPFKGVFDGDNHQIINFQLNSNANFQGLFGKSEGDIKNVILQGEMVTTGARSGNGSLVGWNAGGRIADNHSYVEMSVSGANNAVLGGIVGQNSAGGAVSNNMFSGKIDGFTETGGAKNIGGIIGFNNNDKTSQVYGNINNGTIKGANVTTANQVGGIVGVWSQTGTTPTKTYFFNNINNADVSAQSSNSYVGGIVGQVTGKGSVNTDTYYLFNNLNTGKISGPESRFNDIIGYKTNESYNSDNYVSVNNLYVAETMDVEKGAYTTSDLKKENVVSLLNSNDGNEYNVNVTDDIKYISVTNNYPTLKWNEQEEIDTAEEDLAHLNKALEDLDKSWYVATFKPKFGSDTNIVTLMENKLESLGYTDINVNIKEADEEYIAADGTISYFYKDPNTTQGMWFKSTPVVYELSKNTQKVDTSINAVIHWDRDKLSATMQEQVVDQLEVSDLNGEELDLLNVDSDLKLLKYVKDKDTNKDRRWATISWSSSDEDAIKIVNPTGTIDEQLYGAYTGKIKQSTEEQTITLTASIKNNFIQMGDPVNEDLIIEKTFTIKVKPVGEKLRQEMQEKLNDNYTIEKLTDSITKEKINPDKIVNDIQFLTPSKTGIKDYDSYRFSVTSKNEDLLTVNGYRGNVYRPLPAQEAKKVAFSVTMKHKEFNLEVSKDFEVTIDPLHQDEIDQEIALMNEVKENYFNGLNNNSNISKDQIENRLYTFKEARYDENNNLVWSYNVNNNKDYGIGPVDIDLSRPSEQWNLFKSSKPDIIAHETLNLVKKPSVDTKVTIESVLSSKVFAKYAEKYPDNEDFKKLSRQAVSVEVNVVGEVDYHIASFKKIDQVNVDTGSTLNDIKTKLPDKIIGLDKNDNKSTHSISWDLSKVKVNRAGKYVVEGTITLADQYKYDGELKTTVTINIQSEKTNVVYLSIEKFTIGQGYVLEPIAVEYADGETAEDVVLRVLNANKLEYNYSSEKDYHFLTSIKNVDTGKVEVPQAIKKMDGYDANKVVDKDGNLFNEIHPNLGNYSYNSWAGWYYLVNSNDPQVSMNNYQLNRGDVLRLQFTLYGAGLDLGWDYEKGSFVMPLKDDLTKEIAKINTSGGKLKGSKAYNNALAILQKYDSSQKDIDAALAALKATDKLPTYKTTKKGNTTYYYKLNSSKKYDLYKKVEKTATKTTTTNYRTTGAKKVSSKDIITKKGSKTIQKAHYKYNTKAKLTSSKVYKKNSKNNYVLTYSNTRTYHKNLTTLKTNKADYKNLSNKYTSRKTTTYTAKGYKAKHINLKYKKGVKNARYEYKYNSKGQLKSNKYGKSYRYYTSYNNKGKAVKTTRKQYKSNGKLSSYWYVVKVRASI